MCYIILPRVFQVCLRLTQSLFKSDEWDEVRNILKGKNVSFPFSQIHPCTTYFLSFCLFFVCLFCSIVLVWYNEKRTVWGWLNPPQRRSLNKQAWFTHCRGSDDQFLFCFDFQIIDGSLTEERRSFCMSIYEIKTYILLCPDLQLIWCSDGWCSERRAELVKRGIPEA